MPELPEVAAHAERLHAGWAGAGLAAVELLGFSALKTVDPPLDAGVGSPVSGVGRRGKHLLLHVGTEPPTTYVIHLMQGGRLRADHKLSRRPRGGLVRFSFDGAPALLLTEAGTERRAGMWVVRGAALDAEPLAGLGPDADTLDARGLAGRLDGARGRLHTVLRDQRVLAGVGRRMANEVCHEARLSPFQPVDRLADDGVTRLAEALHTVLDRELTAERARDDLGRAADRDTAVHGRTGEPCPACGDRVREVAYRDYTVHYCAACQTGGRVLADNTTSKFLR